jgi:CheY-like chemotaxis protein
MTELKRILLVEDNPRDVQLALAAFEETHLAHEVVVARDGQEALDFLLREGAYAQRPDGNPAVVLLDLKMPRVNGLEVLARVKANPGLRRVPVVMLTSSREETDLARSYDLGVNAYVVKPVSFPELVFTLKELGLFWTVVNQPPPGTMARVRET